MVAPPPLACRRLGASPGAAHRQAPGRRRPFRAAGLVTIAAVVAAFGPGCGAERPPPVRAPKRPVAPTAAPPASSADVTSAEATPLAPGAAPSAFDPYAWLTTGQEGPLCAELAKGARRRLEAIERAFGPGYVDAELWRPEARREAFLCREDGTRAWALSVAGPEADDVAAPCKPTSPGDDACFWRAERARRATIRTLEAGLESVACWNSRAQHATPCNPRVVGRLSTFAPVGALTHSFLTGETADVDLIDVDGDGRVELVFLHHDANVIDTHGWFVALRTRAPGKPVEEHPAFLGTSVVGLLDVDGNGQRDLITRAHSQHCLESTCLGRDASVLCRLSVGGRFEAPRACPSGPDGPPGDPDRGWAGLARGR
jgi:hypothetical protein